MRRTTLLIMAAGLGSRFGGIKQLEPVGRSGEIIMDYSIHDAIEAGFQKIIIVLRKDIEADYCSRFGKRIEQVCERSGVELKYAFQDMNAIPEGFSVPEGRKKPWGTCHAVLAAREYLNEPFIVVNADDYYGKEAFIKLHDWLLQEHDSSEIAMAGFILKNTLSEHGGVTRGICTVSEDHSHVLNVVETRNIIKTVTGAEVAGQELDCDSYVSMNMWAFPAAPGCKPDFVRVLDEMFIAFFERVFPADPMNSEYLLPTLIGLMLRDGDCTVEVLETQDKWFGVTYREDIPAVVQSFGRLIDAGVYEAELYADLLRK